MVVAAVSHLASRFLNAEIVPADKRLIVAVPGGTVIQSLHASEGDRKNRTFHVALLRVEVLRQP